MKAPFACAGVHLLYASGDDSVFVLPVCLGALRRMMRMVEQQNTGAAPFMPRQHLEINPSHPVIVSLNSLRNQDPDLAKAVAEQVGWSRRTSSLVFRF
jgi:hypothetical protein